MARDPFLHALFDFIRTSRLLDRGNRILVAVSGGIDSIVLLDSLEALRSRLSIELAIAHFNHQLRGAESDEDETFVRKAAEGRALQCYVDRADVHSSAEKEHISVQDAARRLRYEFLGNLRTSHGFDAIATGHNADDNAETILLNLFRGTGVNGLSGIPAVREDLKVVRPLLFASRDEIAAYAKRRGLSYREDSSNARIDYTRNFLRHRIVPLIREHINPNLTGTLQRTRVLFDQLERYIEHDARKKKQSIVSEKSADRIVLDLRELSDAPMYLQEFIVQQTGREFTGSEIDYSTVNEVLTMSNRETGSRCSLSGGAIVYRDRNRLIFTRTGNGQLWSYPITLNQSYDFGSFSIRSESTARHAVSRNPNVEFIDAETVGNDLCVRSWKRGDWFVPFGMHTKKKLSDFFVDQKIPLLEKQSIPILAAGSAIVWIVGRRLDDRHKVTPHTKSIIRFEYIPRHRA